MTNQPTREQLADAIRAAACPGDCGKTEEECAKTTIQPFVWHHGRLAVVEGEPEMFADVLLGLLPQVRAAALTEAADAVFALDYDVMVGEEGDENLGSMREAWDLGTIHATDLLRRMAAEARTTDPHRCRNCEGIDPGTCLMNPDRAAVSSVGSAEPAHDEAPFTPPAHYRRDDGVDCCVHMIPVGPDSCRACRELHDDGGPQ